MNQHIDGAEQLHNGKQPDGYIDRNGCAEGGIPVALRSFAGVAGVAGVAGITGVAAGEAQLRIERNRLTLGKNEGSSLGERICILIGNGGYVCLCRGIALCKTEKALLEIL